MGPPPPLFSGVVYPSLWSSSKCLYSRRDEITLGGTYQPGDSDTSIREGVKKEILENCLRLEPALQVREAITPNHI